MLLNIFLSCANIPKSLWATIIPKSIQDSNVGHHQFSGMSKDSAE
jgi:hypothetical protein